MANLMHPLPHISNHFGLGHIRYMSYLGGRGVVTHLEIRGGRDTLGLAKFITGPGERRRGVRSFGDQRG
jgi:hypothetical protein